MELHFSSLDYVNPPGSIEGVLAHPSGRNETIELALFADHRYAFFFWNKWAREHFQKDIAKPPCLISLDWHQDLMWPNDTEKKWLDDLNITNNRDVALYSWANLTPINDGQIMAAAYLNLIGNIYVHCRQGRNEENWKEETFIDKYGNTHLIMKFKAYDALETHILASNEQHVFWDIDLDFFTLNNPFSGVGKTYTYLKDTEIKSILSIERPLIQWIFKRLAGMTIATEPEFTGGILKSNHFLNLICKLYFKPDLFANYGENWEKSTTWRHLN